MPAQSISLDNEYNARLRNMLYDLEHVDIIKRQPEWLGGGSPWPQKYAHSGNAGQYPPVQMLAEFRANGKAVGGGMDDAKAKARQYVDMAKEHASQFGMELLDSAKPIARRRASMVQKDVRGEVRKGKQKLQQLEKQADAYATEMADKYLGKDQASRTPKGLGGGKRMKKAKKWLEFAKGVGHDAIDLFNEATGKKQMEGEGFGDFLKNSINYGLDKGKDVTIGDIAKGYREMGGAKPKRPPSARAMIVKKVMAEKGCSMIEASKYVKANNLY
jgi:vacuolar-type H+-ATPase subunit H